jgi:glutamate-1-semialdehyde aminotransferase
MIRTPQGQSLYRRAKTIIPGGTQLLSKRPELFAPEVWPPYYRKAAGCRVWDLDGNRFIDMTSMGIGACLLGYADPEVNRAVKEAVDEGSMTTLNCPQEVELAERLLELHPWASMARFARSGGEMMAVAVRIGRAFTGRDGIAFCGYHGWHDWYLAANLSDAESLDGHLLPGLEPRGVPRPLAGTMHGFHYNRIEELDAILYRHRGSIGAVVMEPLRFQAPGDGFLEAVRRRADEIGAVLVFDEITSGFRHAPGGAHTLLGVEPDLAVFAKALGNGVPIAAVIGREEVMQAAQTSFISSTCWTERIGFAAGCATLGELRRRDAPRRLEAAGNRVQEIWKRAAEGHGVPIAVEGRPALCHFSFLHPDAQVLATILTQQLLQRGYLGNTSFYASCAHTGEVLDGYGRAFDQAFGAVAAAARGGHPEEHLQGPPAMKGFARLT